MDDLRRYIARSAEMEAAVLKRIAELADDQSPIYVWGTGTNALHLLATSRLADCNIVAFLDSNPHYAGRRLAGPNGDGTARPDATRRRRSSWRRP